MPIGVLILALFGFLGAMFPAPGVALAQISPKPALCGATTFYTGSFVFGSSAFGVGAF